MGDGEAANIAKTKANTNPPAPWGHQAVRDCLEPSFCSLDATMLSHRFAVLAVKSFLEPSSYRLDDLSLKTDGWYLYECCFPAPQKRHFSVLDVRVLNSGVPPGNPYPPKEAF